MSYTGSVGPSGEALAVQLAIHCRPIAVVAVKRPLMIRDLLVSREHKADPDVQEKLHSTRLGCPSPQKPTRLAWRHAWHSQELAAA